MECLWQLFDFRSIFVYSADKPLLFTQFYFWGFFVIVFAVYAAIYKRMALRNIYLFAVSLFFYYKTGGIFVFLLIFTILSAFYNTRWLSRQENITKRKLLLALCVVVNLLILFYFKYTKFIVDSINDVFATHFGVVNYFSLAANSAFGSNFVTDKIILPVGISFFTFQAISYAIDVYKKEIEPVKSVFDFGFYVSFFPQLVAGPIVRASEFIPQIYKPYSLTKQQFGMALFMILKGLIKKVFISDYISINFIDRVFDAPANYSAFETLMSLYGYSMQVYADFSGYTDIAIGLALMMGFTLSINFNSPYKAKNTAEFWHRWHISLSTWLKDYLYIPIGGNRNGSVGGFICWFVMVGVVCLLSGSLWVTIGLFSLCLIMIAVGLIWKDLGKSMIISMNNLITMLLGGLWHGSSWMFVIWGGYNGFGLVVYKLWKKEKQVLRWILLVLLNSAAFVTYYLNIWHNPNGVILWILSNCVWFFCYFTWIIRLSDKQLNVLKYILGALLIFFFSVVFTVVSGFWQQESRYVVLFPLFLFAAGVFVFADKFKYNGDTKGVAVLLWFGFLTALAICFFGFVSVSSIILLMFFSVLLAGYLFFVVKKQIKEPGKFIAYFWGIFLTFNFITFTRIWFRAPDIETTNIMLERLLNGWDLSLIPQMMSGYKKVFAVMALGYAIHWLSVPYKEKYTGWFINSPIWVKVLVCVFVVFVLYQVKASDLQPFIYFQF